MDTLINFFNTSSIIGVYFRIFSIVFAFLYVLYAVVLQRQTKIMNETVTTAGKQTIQLISTLQVILSLLMLVLAILVHV